MDLRELFDIAAPKVAAFICKTRVLPASVPPVFPMILGTGFFVDADGIVVTNSHVVKIFDKIPPHPKTGQTALAAIMFLPGRKYQSWQMLSVDVKGWAGLASFASTGDWYGESTPDIGFVQLQVRDVPFLKLATEDLYLRVGMNVATIGYPMGDLPLTVGGKIRQVTPFLRSGVVSSVFPFPAKKPDGFTTDILQQGGSSGSPFFGDDPTVVGMMASSMIDWVVVEDAKLGAFSIPQNTNISNCVPAHIIHLALREFRKGHPLDTDGVPTLQELRDKHPEPTESKGLTWDSWKA